MDDQLEAQDIVPQELGWVNEVDANSFSKAVEILKSNTPGKQALAFKGPFHINFKEKRALSLLPNAFDLNRTIQELQISKVEVDDILITKALRVGLRKDKVTSIKFLGCKKVSNQGLMGTMCEGLKERSTAFQLKLSWCSSEFVKPILEASYLKCFSLRLGGVDCTGIGHSIKNLCYRGSLYYISLYNVGGLKEDFFLMLGRCLIPSLTWLNLSGTEVSTSALKRLIGSLKMILDSGRLNMFKHLDLGDTQLDSRLSFACFQVLGSDLVGLFRLRVKEDISRAVVKSISSTVAKTKNLKHLSTGNNFSSGTKFNNFKLQEESFCFYPPFGVNPTVA